MDKKRNNQVVLSMLAALVVTLVAHTLSPAVFAGAACYESACTLSNMEDGHCGSMDSTCGRWSDQGSYFEVQFACRVS